MGESTGLSIADAMALRGEDRDGDGFANSWIWVFFLFFLLAWGGNGLGFGNNSAAQGALTRSDMCQEFNFNDLQNAVRSLQSGLCDGFYSTNMNMQNGFSNVARDLGTGFNAINANINESRFAAQQCCCETNRNIDSVRYENAQNTCNIIQANNMNTQRIIDTITNNTIQDLRDRLQDEKLANSQCAQNAYLVGQLQPVARPAYITVSPYAAQNLTGCSGCGSY